MGTKYILVIPIKHLDLDSAGNLASNEEVETDAIHDLETEVGDLLTRADSVFIKDVGGSGSDQLLDIEDIDVCYDPTDPETRVYITTEDVHITAGPDAVAQWAATDGYQLKENGGGYEG